MAEWFIAPVLKTGDLKGSVGSNPTSSEFIMKQYHYLIAYSYVLQKGNQTLVLPGRIVVDFTKELREEESILEIEAAIKETLEQHKTATTNSLSIITWVGMTSFQLLRTEDIPDPDDQNINITGMI